MYLFLNVFEDVVATRRMCKEIVHGPCGYYRGPHALLLATLHNDFQMVSFVDDIVPPQRILSHTWTESQEVADNELAAALTLQ
jgi:hypothetical protein